MLRGCVCLVIARMLDARPVVGWVGRGVFVRGPVQCIEESNTYLCLMYIGSREYWLLDRSQSQKDALVIPASR